MLDFIYIRRKNFTVKIAVGFPSREIDRHFAVIQYSSAFRALFIFWKLKCSIKTLALFQSISTAFLANFTLLFTSH